MNSFKGKGKVIFVSIILFIAGILTGYYMFWHNPDFIFLNADKFLGNIMKISEAMAKSSKLHVTGLIFQNNIKALLIIMFGGIAFGLVPIFSIFFNGFIIGIVMALSFYQGKTMTFFLAGMLPHGILELPAVLGAGAFGLKTGLDLVYPGKRGRIYLLKENLRKNVLSLGIFVPVLFLAAAVEAIITPHVIKLFT
ncbi:MAG TPA: stage II sporulation protein M [Thermoanaerobacterales bacterium]|nr:stage II sporulation protein M [Thermoanaerobacterales bacterium]